MGEGVGQEASDQRAAEEAEGEEAVDEAIAVIDPDDVAHAERFECYCGRPLDIAPAVVCSGCDYPPLKCTCRELDDAKEAHDAKAGS